MQPNFKPLLGKDIDFTLARWPMLMSTKLDGIRCLIIDGVAMSRSLKPIPNRHVQDVLGRAEFNGLDGELIVGNPTDEDVYNRTQSAVMSSAGRPDFTFHVFDDFRRPNDSFDVRRSYLQVRLATLACPVLVPVDQFVVLSQDGAESLYDAMLEEGYEGAMFRDPAGIYKMGRSTAKEGILLKWKPLVEFDAVILSAYEKQHNGNAAFTNEVGRTARSSHQANKVGLGTLGGVVAREVDGEGMPFGPEFNVGIFKGLKAEALSDLWKVRETLPGRLFKCIKLAIGEKDRPRHPRFQAWRDQIDISA